MIRKKTLSDIRDVLDSHARFTVTDFSIEQKGNKALLIKYNYDDAFFFDVEIPNETSSIPSENTFSRPQDDYKFRAKISPGKISTIENLDFYSEYIFHQKISFWLDCLWEELLEIPVQRQFKEQEKIIEEIKEKLKDVPDEFFSYEDGNELKIKIDKLEAKFNQKFEAEIKDKEKLQKKINDLHKEFETLKSTIFSVKKKSWFTSFATKTFVWFTKEENRKFLKDAKDYIQPLLPDNIKNLLPPSL